MDMQKMKRLKDGICDRLEMISPEDLAKPTMAEYARNLASLHDKLCKICEEMEGDEGYSMRSMRGGAYRDTQEWGAYDGGSSGRRGRNAMGRYTSYDMGYSEGGNPKEQLRRMMDNPDLPREDRDVIRKAMEQMR